jgi:predicted porin
MNKKLGLAVAGAVLAFGASTSAMAGITIPAGDWTVDIGGNVNAFYSNQSTDTTRADGTAGTATADTNTIGTGLLPAALGIGAKTRQNDLDIAFQFSFFTGTSASTPLGAATGLTGSGQGALGMNTLNIRQAFVSFGDASWGSFKLGRDLGVFASDAILSDMTLLGVGAGAPGGSSTLGRIGNGYIYADWKGQIQYTTPNWNGFQVTGAVAEGWTNGTSSGAEDLSYEGKASYDFAANDVTGRVWVSGLTQKHAQTANAYTSKAMDIGAKASYQGFGLVGYYYNGDGMDSQNSGVAGGLQFLGGEKTKDSGGYVQATFVVPGIGTKLGASWGTSNSKAANGTDFDFENKSWIIGAYHPLTKSLNLVAEYINQEIIDGKATGTAVKTIEKDGINLGAILFF